MGFITRYLDYAANNEAPGMFHIWGAFICLSSAISRTVWLPWGRGYLYPDIYVIYVGKAGNGKSVAMDAVRDLLFHITDPTVEITGNVETPEGFLRWVAGEPATANFKGVPSPVRRQVVWPDGVVRDIHPVCIIANEFVNFISKNQEGWINQLVDITGRSEYKYRTKGQGTDVLTGPYVTMLSALTTEISAILQAQHIISTGMARRCLFQHGERDWNHGIPRPMPDAAQELAKQDCLNHLLRIRHLHGEYKWHPDAIAWWDHWYLTELPKVPMRLPQVQGWYATKSDMLVKLAMIHALSEQEELILLPENFESCLRLLTILEDDLFKVFAGSGRNDLAGITIKVYESIQAQRKPVASSTIKAQFWASCRPPNDFQQIVDHLVSTGQIIQWMFHMDGITQMTLSTLQNASNYAALHPEQRDAIPFALPPASVDEAGPLDGLASARHRIDLLLGPRAGVAGSGGTGNGLLLK